MARKKDVISVYPDLESEYGISYVIQSDKTLYLSGLLPMNDNFELVGDGDIEMQIRQIYKRMAFVLSKANATLENVVTELLFITDRTAFAQATTVRREIYEEIGAAMPATTGVTVNDVYLPGALIEIHATAALD